VLLLAPNLQGPKINMAYNEAVEAFRDNEYPMMQGPFKEFLFKE